MEFESLDGSNVECTDFEDDEGDLVNTNTHRRKFSFVWRYFRALEGNTKTYECIICNGSVGNQVSNLSRHLASSHDIKRQEVLEGSTTSAGRARASRSFIWKYCTKEDSKHARCHLCKKSLYFGGGNTSNITKHLRRIHSDLLEFRKGSMDADESEVAQATGSITADRTVRINVKSEGNAGCMPESSSERRERRGGSYVWKYCEKLSRHSIRCLLCNKTMSFHGTANVITHLQRRHHVIGPVDCQNNVVLEVEQNNVTIENDGDGLETPIKRRRRSQASASIVWKYCTRLNTDAVRCRVCKKNLSYQGTSNLQRHLHRMHGIVTQGRSYKMDLDDLPCKSVSDNLIWQHCNAIDVDNVKCNMCNEKFQRSNTEDIMKHLTVTHNVELREDPSNQKNTITKRNDSIEDDDFSNDQEDLADWEYDELDESVEYDESNARKDESLFADVIEEVNDQTNEDPFGPNTLHEMPLANPLSPQSSNDDPPQKYIKLYGDYDKNMQKLNEQRVRMETDYFREKAGFYRMQKYLTALQAKKVRIEVQRLQNGELNGTQSCDNDVQQNILG